MNIGDIRSRLGDIFADWVPANADKVSWRYPEAKPEDLRLIADRLEALARELREESNRESKPQ